jgi:hypothetical protein
MGQSFSKENSRLKVKHGYLIIQWNQNYTKLPEQIRLKASVLAPVGGLVDGIQRVEAATEISVPITLDLKAIAQSGETLPTGYNLGTTELQQPLTFKLISYPNLIKGSAELALRK